MMIPSRHSRLAAALLTIAGQTVCAAPYKNITSQCSNNTIRYQSWPADDATVCNGGSAHHAGWADVQDRHLFFWYHEARHQPDEAPLLIWLQGGPGGSSMVGMFFENGPCLADTSESTRFNPYSWTEHFNLVFLDQPAGVGFSYVDHVDNTSSYPSGVGESSLDAVAVLKLFYKAFPHLSTRDLHLSGESFAGRYIPALASTILDYNKIIRSAGGPEDAQIPLRSLMIGNPMLSPRHQWPSLYDVACHEFRGEYPPHLEEATCDLILPHVDRCEVLLELCAASKEDSILCHQPHEVCSSQYLDVMENETGGRKKDFSLLSEVVLQRFTDSGDLYIPSLRHLEQVLEHTRETVPVKGGRPVDVLVYSGVMDVICNVDGTLEALRDLHWQGRTPFRGALWEELSWTSSSGGRGGRIKSVPNLWFAEIEEAGHMVPHDQPASALRLVQKWLDYIQSQSKPKPVGILRSFFGAQSPLGQAATQDL